MTPERHLISIPTIEDLTRRELIAGALGAALLIACGDDDEDETPAAETREPATRSVETPGGSVEVPSNPRRVMALGEEFMLADLLDLGVEPIASTASSRDIFLGLEAFDTSDVQVLSSTELDVEQVVALQPDLLLVFSFVADAIGLDALNQIAPTVAIDPTDYRSAYRSLASVFGREEKAEARLAEYDAAAASAGEALGAASRTVSVVTIYPGSNITVWVGGPVDLPQAVLDMGFALVPDAQALPPTGTQNRASISLEQVEVLAGDDLLMLQSGSVEGEDAAVVEVTSSETWRRIPAIAAGRVHTVDRLGHPGVPGRLALIEELKATLGG